MDLLPGIALTVSSYAKKMGEAPFDICLRENLDTIFSTIDQTLNVFVCGLPGKQI